MIIIDASVLTNALTDDGGLGTVGRAELARDTHWAAPEHLVVETFSAIRGRFLASRISELRCRDALEALRSASIELVNTAQLLQRMWELRANLSSYDSAYVAAAEGYDCPLLTGDARLARAPGLRCDLRLAVPAG